MVVLVVSIEEDSQKVEGLHNKLKVMSQETTESTMKEEVIQET